MLCRLHIRTGMAFWSSSHTIQRYFLHTFLKILKKTNKNLIKRDGFEPRSFQIPLNCVPQFFLHKFNYTYVGFDFLSAAVMNVAIFWDIVQCSTWNDVSVEFITSIFKAEYQPSKKPECNRRLDLAPYNSCSLIFESEDGCDTSETSLYIRFYMVLYPRRWQH
jgi:hypothetical protein